MRVKYYQDDDVLVLKMSNKPIDYAEESDDIVVHFDVKKKPVRIEVLDAHRFLKAQARALPKMVKQEYFLPAVK